MNSHAKFDIHYISRYIYSKENFCIPDKPQKQYISENIYKMYYHLYWNTLQIFIKSSIYRKMNHEKNASLYDERLIFIYHLYKCIDHLLLP